MTSKLLFAASFLLAALGNASAEEMSWSFPSPEEYSAHLTELCKPESSSAIYIANLRDKGFTKDQVASSLPQGTPDRLRLSHVVKENLDDLFAYPEVNIVTYYAFRGKACVREKAEGKPIVKFSSIATDALKCQKELGLSDRVKLATCIRALLQ
jgi:hypothetical protein